MTSDNTILTIAIIAVVVSGIGLYLTYFNIFAFENILLTPGDTSITQVEIQEDLIIEFIAGYDTINWGAGAIVAPDTSVVLDTGINPAGPSVTGAHTDWPTTNINGFRISNTGNVDANLFLATGNNSVDFICNQPVIDSTCGVGDIPDAEYNYSVYDLETGSCLEANRKVPFAQYMDVNKTNDPITYYGTLVCDRFQTEDSNDVLEIDIRLRIPNDADVGARSDVMYATAQVASGPEP